MNSQILFSELLAVASACPEGYTVRHNDLAPVTTGFAVAVAATQNSFGPEGLRRVIEYVQENAPRVNAFGGWYNSEDGQFYFDATIVVEDEAEARALAIENAQIAYFNLNTCTEVRL